MRDIKLWLEDRAMVGSGAKSKELLAYVNELESTLQKQAAYITQLEKIVNNMDATINEIDDIARVI